MRSIAHTRICPHACACVRGLVTVDANEVFHVVLVDLSDDSRDYLEDAGRYTRAHAP